MNFFDLNAGLTRALWSKILLNCTHFPCRSYITIEVVRNHFYSLSMLLLNVLLFEYFRSRKDIITMNDLPAYTKSQLALRNGQDKPLIWVCFKGLIYDVTESRLWKNGKHYEHWAGQDLTDELKDAPHTDSVFSKFKVIGRLILAN